MIHAPLRNQIRDHLRREVIDGTLRPGEQLILGQLADRLSVSPTPAREALGQLEGEGLVRLEPNRGFFVAPMTEEEALEMYPLLAELEALALELPGPPPADDVRRLRELNGRMERARSDPEDLFRLDREWHELLVTRCSNSLVLGHLESMRNRVERYERAYMEHSGSVPFSTRDHHLIVGALEREPGDLRRLLRAHWKRSSSFVREWLGGREERGLVRRVYP